MVIIVLLVQRNGIRIHGGCKTHFFKVLYSHTYHALKADGIIHLQDRLDTDILACRDKSNTEAFRVGICHTLNLLVTERIQVTTDLHLILTDAISIAVQICGIRQI